MLRSKLVFYATFLMTLFFSITQAYAFSVSEEEINDYLAKKGEISDQIGLPNLFGMNYKIQNLTTKIGQSDSKRVEVSGTLDGLINLQRKAYAGKINLTIDTIPYYDPKTGSIYLRDLRIINWSGSPQTYMEKIEPIMPYLNQSIAMLMTNMPIYTLDETKPREMLIKKFAKGISVEKGRISLETDIL
ncbi:DUF1439 domain-containing protein [Pasteurella bettyae]|nr:DUF1439 domain-containing protein [Pasteurella bettyae]SUB21883.1 Uncharacterized lipoprotein yceB precursor [Pasteurella bettyae]